MAEFNLHNSRASFEVNGKSYNYYRLAALEEAGIANVSRLPYSIKVLLESVLRQYDNYVIKEEHVNELAKFGSHNPEAEVPFKPSRVVLQDFTGVPVVVDLASLRSAMKEMGGNPDKINPAIPVDLVIDHSVVVDKYGNANALNANMDLEFERNAERYNFLKWAQTAYDNFRAVPPATGIVHQVNLEYLAPIVHVNETEEGLVAFPDSVVGTDSHTTMINGIGVLGWGVGGIEAEAGMLGQPSYFPIPDVIGVKLVGELPNGTTATDLALKVTQVLRQRGVVNKFVEFFGPGVAKLPLADRATISNMAPEYGATCGFFAIDEESINYMRLTGRDEEHIAVVEAYLKVNNMWFDPTLEPVYTDVLEINLADIEANLSGPKRPQDLIPLSEMKKVYRESVVAPQGTQGFGLTEAEFDKTSTAEFAEGAVEIPAGAVAIAAITSCTNTSNPYVLLAAGLVAKKAVELGIKPEASK